jgi:hypothetical protein
LVWVSQVFKFNPALKAKLKNWKSVYDLTIPDRVQLVSFIIADTENHQMLIRNTNPFIIQVIPQPIVEENPDLLLNLQDDDYEPNNNQDVEDVQQGAEEQVQEIEEDAEIGEEEELQEVEGTEQENSQPESDKSSQESEKEPQPSPPKRPRNVFVSKSLNQFATSGFSAPKRVTEPDVQKHRLAPREKHTYKEDNGSCY